MGFTSPPGTALCGKAFKENTSSNCWSTNENPEYLLPR